MKKYRKGLAAIVFAVLLVSLSACASKKLTVNEAEALVRAEMQEILQEQETEETGSYEIHVLKNTSQVTVKSIEMDGKSAVAVCQIRSLDLHSALSALLESMKNQQVGVSAYEEMLKEAVDNAEYTEADLMAETEADSSQKYWQVCAAKNRQVFAELSLNAAAPPEYLCDYIGMTVDEIAEIWGEDYEAIPSSEFDGE